MKTMKNFLSMAALALMGAMMTGCSNDDNFDNPQQPENKSNVVTLTTTVGLGGSNGTRALDASGHKTFAVGDKIALVYKNTSGSTVKVESAALTDGNITNSGKSATFTFELTDPDKAQEVTYIYPAAMAKADGTVNYSALNSQDGTLTSLATNLDYCTKSGAWDSGNLPTLTLENQLAILAITLKNADGSSDITSSITGLTLSDGTKTYNVTREAVAGPIYVAIFPTADATITVTATDGTTKNYTKTLTGKTYAKDNGYSVSWKMTQVVRLAGLTGDYTAQDGDVLTGTLGSNVKISIADGATVTLKDVNINGGDKWTYGAYAGITCVGNATITLEGTNTVKGFAGDYPGIYVPENNTLIIQGSGSLEATGRGDGAGIGGGYDEGNCGNITIIGGDVTAVSGVGGNAAGIGTGLDGTCGDITISGGTVTATGGELAAGIGCGGGNSTCGDIFISGGTVTATGGSDAAGIGGGYAGADCTNMCGNITITSGVIHVTATMGESNEDNSTGPESIGAGGYCNGEWDEDLEEILSYGVIICGDVTIEDDSKVTQK